MFWSYQSKGNGYAASGSRVIRFCDGFQERVPVGGNHTTQKLRSSAKIFNADVGHDLPFPYAC